MFHVCATKEQTQPLTLNGKHIKQNIQNNFKERAMLMWAINSRDKFTGNN